MTKSKDRDQILEQKLDVIIGLLRHLLALELARNGVKQALIGKHLQIAKAKVGTLLENVNKEKRP